MVLLLDIGLVKLLSIRIAGGFSGFFPKIHR